MAVLLRSVGRGKTFCERVSPKQGRLRQGRRHSTHASYLCSTDSSRTAVRQCCTLRLAEKCRSCFVFFRIGGWLLPPARLSVRTCDTNTSRTQPIPPRHKYFVREEIYKPQTLPDHTKYTCNALQQYHSKIAHHATNLLSGSNMR